MFVLHNVGMIFFQGVSLDLISESLGVCHCGQYLSNVFGRSRKLADARGMKLADNQLCYSVLTGDRRLLSLNPLLRRTWALQLSLATNCYRTEAQSPTFKGHRTPHSVTGQEEPKILHFPSFPPKTAARGDSCLKSGAGQGRCPHCGMLTAILS